MDLSNLVKHRKFIMGCAIIWILLVHATVEGAGFTGSVGLLTTKNARMDLGELMSFFSFLE